MRLTNPVFQRIAQPDRGPSLLVTALIGVGVWFTLSVTLASTNPWGGVFVVLLAVFASWYALPVVLAILGVLTIWRHTESDAFPLVRLTALNPRELMFGLLAGAGYRLRVLLAIGISLLVLEFTAGFVPSQNYFRNASMGDWGWVFGVAVLGALLVTRVGWMLAGVSVGILFGLRAGSQAAAVAYSITTMVVIMGTMALLPRLAALLETMPAVLRLARRVSPMLPGTVIYDSTRAAGAVLALLAVSTACVLLHRAVRRL